MHEEVQQSKDSVTLQGLKVKTVSDSEFPGLPCSSRLRGQHMTLTDILKGLHTSVHGMCFSA